MKLEHPQSLDRILESAIVVSWNDLMRGAPGGLIHIEYNFAQDSTLEYVKVWSSKNRGDWLLACEYWMSASTFHGAGIRFINGYHSQGLANILEFVMQHQTAFSLPANLGRQGLLQIPPPMEEESVAAASVEKALDHHGWLVDPPASA